MPQSEGYDGDATAFVQLPPEFMLEGVPLEAPGHGYVPPPMITPLTPLTATEPAPEPVTDPAATGPWQTQSPVGADGTGFPQEPAPEAAYEQTASWTVPTVEEAPGGQDVRDVRDGSGEYTASAPAHYTSSAPATLPGGAPAPWAVTEPEPVPSPEYGAAYEAGAGAAYEAQAGAEAGAAYETQAAAEDGAGAEPAPEAELVPAPVAEPVPASVPVPENESGPEPVVAEEAPAEEVPVPPVDPAATPPVDMPTDIPTGMPADLPTESDEHPHISYTLRVNGADRPVTDSWIGESLLYVLRERLGLAGAKDGCSQGECGACNVQVDGRLVASCLVPAATAAGSEVRTVEGLAVDGQPSDVQRALAKCGVQCGFCIPGMAMTVHDLLEGNHAPTELETRQALCGNLCRCSGYRGVLDAVREVVAEREASARPGDETAARIPHQIPHPHDGGTA
ncbi:2Fe-2S iron-sulfur cluster-binding protein [Streptomyces sp. NPDC126499]